MEPLMISMLRIIEKQNSVLYLFIYLPSSEIIKGLPAVTNQSIFLLQLGLFER